MRKSIYIETSVISYLAARPSKSLIASAWQQITSEWWETQRERFDLCVSELVISEAEQGDVHAAEKRLNFLNGIPVLPVVDEAIQLADRLIVEGVLPKKAADDAMHISLAAVHGVDYLLTWNCRHIDNAETKPLFRSICAVIGHQCPEICTPQELMGAYANE